MSETDVPTVGEPEVEHPTPANRIREAHVAIDETGFDAIGIGGLVSLLREAGLDAFEVLACDESGAIVRVDMDEPLAGDRLAALESVDDWTDVSGSDGRSYVIELTAPAFPPSLARRTADLLDACTLDVEGHGATVSLVGSQEAIAEVVRAYEAAGLAPDLRKLGSYTRRADSADPLTERQREVLETAYELGYYEVPREASARDVAARLDVDASTVSEHLQRAERNLLSAQLST